MGNARWSVVVVLLCLSCGAGAPSVKPYPAAVCPHYDGLADDWCDGRVTTLGILKRDPMGVTSFYAVDLEGPKDEKTRSPFVYGFTCNGCPLQVGATYRVRLSKQDSVYTLLLDGTEISYSIDMRPDRLNVMGSNKYTCLEGQVDSHWTLDAEGGIACAPGTADPTRWVSGDGLSVGSPTCSTGFPTGFVAQFGDGTPNVTVNVQLSSSYELDDPELAHDLFPEHLIGAMNQIHTDAYGWPGDRQFALADGLPHLYFQVTLTNDGTNDHYGMDVIVSGPKDRPTLGAGGYQAVTLFTYTVPPVYISALKLTQAAAVGAMEYLNQPGGWNCINGVATPRMTRKQMCAYSPDNATLQASALCTIQ